MTRWKSEAINNLPQLFESENSKLRKQAKNHEAQVEELYTQIGRLTTELSWLKKNLVSEYTSRERLEMMSQDDEMTIRQQAKLLGVNWSTFYYRQVPPDPMDLYIKRLIDEAHTSHPELGSLRIGMWLKQQHSLNINRKAVQRHMREMGIEAVYPRPNTSKPNPEHKIYPYLLKNLDITRPNQVWSIDITYIPIQRSFLYPVAIIDWFSRYVIGWEIDDTLDIRFVLEVCRNALAHCKQEIMNSDQGSHFSSPKYLGLFLDVGSRISMDHRGRAFDNIFIERLWRSVKYENVYLKDYQRLRDARVGLNEYFHYYNLLLTKKMQRFYKNKKF